MPESADQPPEWQGERLGTFGPDRYLLDNRETFDVERAPTNRTCRHYDSREDQFDPQVEPCGKQAVYRFYVRDTDSYAWNTTDRCAEHATGPALEALLIPEAEELLWNDGHEVYCVCTAHYHEHKQDQWSGFTENDHLPELRETMQERLEAGVPCSFCQRDLEGDRDDRRRQVVDA